MAKVTQKKVTSKKKLWIPVYGSNNFEGLFLGESLGEKPADLMNRIIEANLGEILKDMKRQNVKLYFKVNDIKEGRAIADIVRYNIMSTFLRRSAVKLKNKMNDSFTCKTKDGIDVQLKPLLLTKSSTQKAVLSVIRKKVRQLLIADVATVGYYELVDAIVNYRLQKALRDRVKKVYPLSVCEIRMMERLTPLAHS